MAEQRFSWLTETTLEPSITVPSEEQKIPDLSNIKQRVLTHKKTLIGIAALFLILLILKLTQEEKVAPSRGLDVMIAVLPIPKGQVIEGMLLKPARISPSSISKAQKLSMLRPEDAEKIMGKLRAKKDIPPQKPIFWNELEIIPAAKTINKIPIPVVTYPEI